MNSRNSSDLGLAAPVVPRSFIPRSLSIHGFQLHAVRRLVRSHRRPDRVACLLKVAPSDGQTEDGHAMMKF